MLFELRFLNTVDLKYFIMNKNLKKRSFHMLFIQKSIFFYHDPLGAASGIMLREIHLPHINNYIL